MLLSKTILRTNLVLWGLLMCFSSALKSEEVSAQATVSPAESKRTLFVMQKLLSSLGMSLPDDKKNNPTPEPDPTPTPKPTPKPEPKPAPTPAPAPAPEPKPDDFFSDDDFFESDASFDDMKKAMEEEYNSTAAAWQKEYDETVARWEKAKKEFTKNIDKHKSATIDIDAFAPSLTQSQSPSLTSTTSHAISALAPGDFYVIPGAMEIPIRSQAYRGTCAAFTGVRAMETILMQNDISADLSEQHFYWLSKPKCQKQPCTKAQSGSWFTYGLINSRLNKEGILTEADCPYSASPIASNETQTPLNSCQFRPGVRAGKYKQSLTLPSVLDEIAANHPVMAGVKLSDNFYKDNIITQRDIGKYSGKKDNHAGGHAVLLIGYIRLPQQMNEGNFCVITANSWGYGWGAGGYGCLTEKWLNQYKIDFDSLSSVELTNTFKHQ